MKAGSTGAELVETMVKLKDPMLVVEMDVRSVVLMAHLTAVLMDADHFHMYQ